MSEEVEASLLRHLLRDDGQEDLAFAIWHPSEGASRTTALLHHVMLPEANDRQVHGNASFNAQYFERALRSAQRHRAGVALLHSHPRGKQWQGLSDDDFVAEAGHAGSVAAATGLPFVGLTVAGSSKHWSARFWQRVAPKKYEPSWCDTVRTVGSALRLSFHRAFPPPVPAPELMRSVAVWGEASQADFARLHVGVVGAGSVGALVSEALARMGVGRVSLIDFDRVERHNLDRLLHATRRDVGELKVSVVTRAISECATASSFRGTAIAESLTTKAGYRAALDCDVLFSCVDRPWPKRIMNHLAYGHLVPVIDGGIAIFAPKGKLKHADWSVRTAGPSRACLECVGSYDPALVAVEIEGFLDRPHYIEGLPEDHPFRRNENVFPFSMSVAAHEVLQLVALVTGLKGMHNVGEQRYHYYPGFMEANTELHCVPGCPHQKLVARGDADFVLYAKDARESE